MVRPFGDELAVDAAAAVVVIIVVTAAQVLAFYKALEHEHEAVRARLPPLSRNWWATIKAKVEADPCACDRTRAVAGCACACPLLPM